MLPWKRRQMGRTEQARIGYRRHKAQRVATPVQHDTTHPICNQSPLTTAVTGPLCHSSAGQEWSLRRTLLGRCWRLAQLQPLPGLPASLTPPTTGPRLVQYGATFAGHDPALGKPPVTALGTRTVAAPLVMTFRCAKQKSTAGTRETASESYLRRCARRRSRAAMGLASPVQLTQ
jgi:hypothetical protein